MEKVDLLKLWQVYTLYKYKKSIKTIQIPLMVRVMEWWILQFQYKLL